MYNPAPIQPLGVFFDLELGGLKRIFSSPEVPVEMRMRNQLGGTCEVEFTLYDLTGAEVEPEIWNARDPQTNIPGGTFQFGYTNGKQSNRIPFMIESYTPVFAGNAFVITLAGSSILTPYVSSNQNSGTIQEILEKFCADHKLGLSIDPALGPVYMQDVGYNDQGNTSKMEMRHHKWANESDAGYIERILSWARDTQGKGGYRWHIGSDQNGLATLFVTRPLSTSASLRYEVQAADSVVVEWKPDIDFSSVIWGQNDVQQNCYQRLTGDEQKTVLQKHLTEDFQETFGYQNTPSVRSSPSHPDAGQLLYFNTEAMPAEVTGSSVRSRAGSSISPGAGINPFLNTHLLSWMASFTGTLTILGDPGISVLDASGRSQLIDVVCYYPINYKNQHQGRHLHYTSGTSMLEEVAHLITAGSYLTVLHLSRANAPVPEVTS
ncbi:MAG: hypothetical protein K2Z81_01250 [Cyanobacteria bacterium]|nr:hypothetical protein [Cyanobacteriota bacterium]